MSHFNLFRLRMYNINCFRSLEFYGILDTSCKITRLFSLSRPKFSSDHIFRFVAMRAVKTEFAPTKPTFATQKPSVRMFWHSETVF